MTNQHSRMHWAQRKREADVWKALIRAKAYECKIDNLNLPKAHITLTRHSSRCPDYDGLVSSFKRAIDGLVDAQVIQDDSFHVIGASRYLWVKAPPGKGFVTIKIEVDE